VSKLAWDNVGQRLYETGVSKGVLYLPDTVGAYTTGFAWNGLTKVTEKPTGAAATAQYADNSIYLNLVSTERFDADIEAFTYPDAFSACDGSAEPEPGVMVNQQPRKSFGLAYRTELGNDLVNTEYGYKLHLVYNALAAPSQRDYATINDNPAAVALVWSLTTTPIAVPGYKNASTLTIDASRVDHTALLALEDFLYGTAGTDPSLPTPAAVLALFSGTITTVTPTGPTYTAGTHTVNIPVITGVTYYINDLPVTGGVVIAVDTVVTAQPNVGYKFSAASVDEWLMPYS
jgi:hypothetical protein